MKARLITTLSKLNEGDFTTKGQTIDTALNSVEGLALFPDPLGDPTKDPTRVQLSAAVAAHLKKYEAALNGDKSAIIARNDSRAALTVILQALAPILEDIADYDAEKLSKTGYDLRKERSPAISGTLPAPQNLKLSNGNDTGTIKVTVTKLAGAKSYDVWICTGDPNTPANWRQAIVAGRCRGIEVSGLVEATKYYVRVRGIGSMGPGGWSNIESIIVT